MASRWVPSWMMHAISVDSSPPRASDENIGKPEFHAVKEDLDGWHGHAIAIGLSVFSDQFLVDFLAGLRATIDADDARLQKFDPRCGRGEGLFFSRGYGYLVHSREFCDRLRAW